MKKRYEKSGWKGEHYHGHEFKYYGSGVLFGCNKCGQIKDLYNAVPIIKRCKRKPHTPHKCVYGLWCGHEDIKHKRNREGQYAPRLEELMETSFYRYQLESS